MATDNIDVSDLYIGYPDGPRFVVNRIIEDDLIRVIVQKYEMILFTNKGDVFGSPDFGSDLPKLLFQTKVSQDTVKKIILEQIYTYIPEIADRNFTLNVEFFADPNNYQDAMQVNFTIADYEIYAIIA